MVRNHYLVYVGGALRNPVCGVLGQYGVAVRLGEPLEFGTRMVPGRAAGAVVELDCQVALRAPVYAALEALRARHPLLPLLALVHPHAACDWSRLSALDVECAQQPVSRPLLHRFAQRALAFGALPDEAVAHWVSYLARQRGLTAREVQLLTFALQHVPRAEMRRVLGITENTLKTQIRALLRKCGEPSLDALAKNTLRVALLSARPGARDVYRAPWVPTDACLAASGA